ncbi:MAG TPA: FlgD immunoglobulin-like domain containing protein [Gemmatimonadales bacterium]|nr:FlgD immunoglobulin-like domain containing protein [Gemmatimonadales bacterium]
MIRLSTTLLPGAVVFFALCALPVVAQGQSASDFLDQGIRAYAVREYDGGAWLLRRALSDEGAGALSTRDAARATMYLMAIEVARNQRDSALAAARRLVVLDPRIRPDEQSFSPQVIAVYQEARRSSPSVSIRAPGDTEIRPGSEVFVVRLGSNAAPEVSAVVTGADGRVVRSLYSGTIRDSVDVRWNGLDASGNTPPAGRYSIVVTPAGKDRRAWMLRLPLELARPSVDTAPLPPAPPDSLFRPERGNYSSAFQALIPGVVAAGAIVVVPNIVASGEQASKARFVVGGTVAIASIAAFFSHNPGQRIPANEQYNRNLREGWKRTVAETSRRNAERLKGARLVIRPGAPSLTTVDTP